MFAFPVFQVELIPHQQTVLVEVPKQTPKEDRPLSSNDVQVACLLFTCIMAFLLGYINVS